MAAAKKKLIKMQNKTCKKAQSKNQSIGIRRLALSNSKAVELGTFKNVFSNPATAPLKPNKTFTFASNQFFDNDLTFGPVLETLDIANNLTTARLKTLKKKAKSKILSRHFSKKLGGKAFRALMASPIAIKLIKPGKQRVRISANAIENTFSKRIHQLSFN